MTGNFTIGLLEILAYLVPGGLMVSGVLYFRSSELLEQAFTGLGHQIAFLGCSYIVGQLLTFLSSPMVRIRVYLRLLLPKKPREHRMPFYTDLQQKLQGLFGEELSRKEHYYFSLRLVIEHQPHSAQTIDRLYAMTLFSRNVALAFLLIGGLFLIRNSMISLVSVLLAILFFLRYAQLEATTFNTVLRCAYVYLCHQENTKVQKAKQLIDPDASIFE